MSRITRTRNVVLSAAAVAAVLGVFVSTSAGSTASRASRATAITQQYGSATAALGVRAHSAGARYAFVTTHNFTLVAQHFISLAARCPSSHPIPISGFFGTSGDEVYATASSPVLAKHEWYTRLTNVSSTGQAATVYAGVVCA